MFISGFSPAIKLDGIKHSDAVATLACNTLRLATLIMLIGPIR
ncbi:MULTISPECIES: hypothetical protein [Enterovibrio]|nr:hypothetical protein [Enterovibrio norvegicus]